MVKKSSSGGAFKAFFFISGIFFISLFWIYYSYILQLHKEQLSNKEYYRTIPTEMKKSENNNKNWENERSQPEITEATYSKDANKDHGASANQGKRDSDVSFDTIHFIHIPKCGGTSMTAVLRQAECTMDPIKNIDCCTNPGFCDHNDNKKCKAIKGCINHFPQLLLSAWFYRGHNPNNDFFQVREEFKSIKFGQRPKRVFSEYLEMHEYQNIQSRMLGANSFPYRNITVDETVFSKAVSTLPLFYFIGIQEAYDLSVELLLRKMKLNVTIPISKERLQQSKKMEDEKRRITENSRLMSRAREVNSFDRQLYAKGKASE